MTWRKLLKALLFILFTVGIFWILFQNVDPEKVLDEIRAANLGALGVCVLLIVPFYLLATMRWWLILRAMKFKVGFWRALAVTVGERPMVLVTPSVSGLFLRSIGLRKEVMMTEGVGSILVERFIDFYTLAFLCMVGMIGLGRYLLAGGCIVALVLIHLVLAWKRPTVPVPIRAVKSRFERLFTASRVLQEQKLHAMAALACSFLVWLNTMVAVYALFLAVGVDPGFEAILAYFPLAHMVGIIPVTAAGMGTRDAAMLGLFAAYGAQAQLLSVGLLYSVVWYWVLALLGLPFVRYLLGTPTPEPDPEPETATRIARRMRGDTSGWVPTRTGTDPPSEEGITPYSRQS